MTCVDGRTLWTIEAARASREIVVEAAHKETLRSALDGGKAAVHIQRKDRDGGRCKIQVEAAAREQTLTPARRVDHHRAAVG